MVIFFFYKDFDEILMGIDQEEKRARIREYSKGNGRNIKEDGEEAVFQEIRGKVGVIIGATSGIGRAIDGGSSLGS